MYAHPLFDFNPNNVPTDERVQLAYQRARAILRTYDLSVSDVLNFTPKFWAMHLDPIIPLDIGCFTVLAAHVNLTIGTIGRFLDKRPDLQPLMRSLLRLDTVGVYLLSERGHGLDAFNIETTATKTPQGFILNTPREEAAKYMPATTPLFGVPKIALVMARLIVDGTDRGSRFFLVPICTATEMHPGVTSLRLPRRSGTSPLDFSMTLFHNVVLPPGALLNASPDIPAEPRAAWWDEVWRIPYGSMTVAAPCVQGLKHAAYIGGRYSLTRTVAASRPIISFPTQQWAVLHAVAAGTVLDVWYRTVIDLMTDAAVDPRVKHGMAVVVKATACRQAIACTAKVAERCGAQGTFENNFFYRFETDCRGIIIAEGDVLTLCIRLFGELVLGRYALPLPPPADSVLAARAHAVLANLTARVRALPGGHRSPDAEHHLLPNAERAVMAIGHAAAYAAARRAGVAQPLLDIYECGVVREDPLWFAEHAARPSAAQADAEIAALRAAAPHLPGYLDALGVERYVRASIVSGEAWRETVDALPRYRCAGGGALTSSAGGDARAPWAWGAGWAGRAPWALGPTWGSAIMDGLQGFSALDIASFVLGGFAE